MNAYCRVRQCSRNWPLPQGTDDARYLAVLDAALVAIRAFAPRHVIVSAGFDIAAGDPVGGFNAITVNQQIQTEKKVEI